MTSASEAPVASFDQDRLRTEAPLLRAEYLKASPWPHVVIKDLFPDSLIAAAAAECMQVQPDELLVTAGPEQMKQESPAGLGPCTTELQRALDSDAFKAFLETVTGVKDLQPDPSHALGGMHRSLPGGFTLIHRDFRRHPQTDLHHRVNMLLYLNPTWEDEWGGFLELWPSDVKAVGRRIAPRGNTVVLWETHDQTLHGLPDPVACPPDISRVSLASYWYTEQPRETPVKLRRPVFARRPQDSWRLGRRKPVRFLKVLVAPKRSFF
jgi:hypothetical protein